MKKLTWIAGLMLLLIAVITCILCFYQYPSQDDFVGLYLKRYYGGLESSIKWYLREQNGRFTTIPLFLTVSSTPFLMDHYGWLLLFLIGITGYCAFIFLRVLLAHLFNIRWPFVKLACLTLMLLFVFLTLVPQVSTFFYWFATSITYLLPLGIFLLLLCSYSFLLRAHATYKWGWTAATGLLTFLLGGCNEIMLFYGAALPFLIAYFFLTSGKKIPVPVYITGVVALLTVLLVMNMPGNGMRAAHFEQRHSLVTSIAGALLLTWDNFSPIFSSPLFYLCSYALFLASFHLPPSLRAFFAQRRVHWIADVACLFILVFCFHAAIRQVGNSEVPLRGVNILVCLSVIGLWWIVLTHSCKVAEKPSFPVFSSDRFTRLFTGLFMIALLGSVFFRQLINNIVEAPVHAHVMKERIRQVQQSRTAGKHTVYIATYQQNLEAAALKRFGLRKWFFMEKFTFPPSFSFFHDEPNSQRYARIYAEYYGIDSIANEQGRYARWGLVPKAH